MEPLITKDPSAPTVEKINFQLKACDTPDKLIDFFNLIEQNDNPQFYSILSRCDTNKLLSNFFSVTNKSTLKPEQLARVITVSERALSHIEPESDQERLFFKTIINSDSARHFLVNIESLDENFIFENLEQCILLYLKYVYPQPSSKIMSPRNYHKLKDIFLKNYRDPLYYRVPEIFDIVCKRIGPGDRKLINEIIAKEMAEPVTPKNLERKSWLFYYFNDATLLKQCLEYIATVIPTDQPKLLQPGSGAIKITLEASTQDRKDLLRNFLEYINNKNFHPFKAYIKEVLFESCNPLPLDCMKVTGSTVGVHYKFVNSGLTMKHLDFIVLPKDSITTDEHVPDDVKKHLFSRAIMGETSIFCGAVDAFDLLDPKFIEQNYSACLSYYCEKYPDKEIPKSLLNETNLVVFLCGIINYSKLPSSVYQKWLQIAGANLPQISQTPLFKIWIVGLPAILRIPFFIQLKPEAKELFTRLIEYFPKEAISAKDNDYIYLMTRLEAPFPKDFAKNNWQYLLPLAKATRNYHVFNACAQYFYENYKIKLEFSKTTQALEILSIDEPYNILDIIAVLKLIADRWSSSHPPFHIKQPLNIHDANLVKIYEHLGKQILNIDYDASNKTDPAQTLKLLLDSCNRIFMITLVNLDLNLLVEKSINLLKNFTIRGGLILHNCTGSLKVKPKSESTSLLDWKSILISGKPVGIEFANHTDTEVTFKDLFIENLSDLFLEVFPKNLTFNNATLSEEAQQQVCSLIDTSINLNITKTHINPRFVFLSFEKGEEQYLKSYTVPEFQAKLLKVFPPTNDENECLYPVLEFQASDQLQGGVGLSLIPKKALLNPHAVLSRLQPLNRIRSLKTHLMGSPGVDASGLSRQLIAQIVMGLTMTDAENLRFELSKSDNRYVPVDMKMTETAKNNLVTLGKLMVFAANSGKKFLIGEIFPARFFQALTMVNQTELEGEIQHDRLIELCNVLYDVSEHMYFFDHYLNMRKLTDISQVTEEQKQFYINQFASDEIPALDVLKQELDDYYLPLMRQKLRPLQLIAQGISRGLPIDIDKTVIANWEMLKTVPCAQLDELIQGRFTKEKLIELLVVEFHGNSNQLSSEEYIRRQKITEQIKGWLVEWISTHTEEEVKTVLKTITGAPTAALPIKFKLHDIKYFNIHTCFNLVDMPADVTKETFFAELNTWSKGKSLHFNQS